MPILDGGANSLSAAVGEAFEIAGGMVAAALETAPALVLGLAVIAVLPVLIAGGAILRRLGPAFEYTRRAGQTVRVDGGLAEALPHGAALAARAVPAYSRAVVAVEADDAEPDDTVGGSCHQSFQFGAAMVARIGREEDNDIQLRHPTVHRYHALIRRSFGEGYEIADLSDANGNGVLVNGERVTNVLLADGDEIRLGAARLRFGLPP
ncbi:MAG: FHA domain-containing protein [Alphaproteobacteria bacterium]|nr:FHA domain-containing protein [Alphaproteobacteria bacterium]